MPLGELIALDREACDLSRPEGLPAIIKHIQPDVIVNAGAYTAVDKAEQEEELATLVNGTAVGVLAAEAKRHGSLLIHYSTDYVFDGRKSSPYREDDEPNPINAYGRSKLAGERALREIDCDYLIIRTSWVYAARGRNFLKNILRLAQEREELSVVADQIGAPTWARDIADATARMVHYAYRERDDGLFASGIFNVTAGGSTSWYGFAEAILDLALSRRNGLMNKPRIRKIVSLDYPSP